MTHRNAIRAKSGQAMVELVIALITLAVIIIGTTTFAQLALNQLYLRRDARADAGKAALNRSTAGWIDLDKEITSPTSTAHKINAFARLEEYSPALTTRLPASNYTLHARSNPIGELGLRTTVKQKTVPLDQSFVSFIYATSSQSGSDNGGTIRLKEKIVYPATDDLWPNSND